jgi:16S rRNA (guanine527-N7)-methyltransferase
MDTGRIAELLQPFLPSPAEQAVLSNISTYIDILRRWNARINLTAVRQPEEIVTRHFGESLFAARHLFPGADMEAGDSPTGAERGAAPRVVDVGSGAGFPGLPLKLWAPQIRLTLIESNQKKATFLREVMRSLKLTNVEVFSRRAQDFPAASADVVTLRAVEKFESVLPVAARLVCPGGRLALLIGRPQAASVPGLAPEFQWNLPLPVPLSEARVLLVGDMTAMAQESSS